MMDIKVVLLFFSVSMGPFLLHLVFNLFYFLLLNAAAVAAFFILYPSDNAWMFPIFLVVTALFSLLVRRSLFLKWHLGINIHFIHFLSRVKEGGSELETAGSPKVNLPRKPGKLLKEIKKELKKGGMARVSTKLSTVIAAAHLAGLEPLPIGTARFESIRRLSGHVLRLTFIEAMAFSILLVPFGLISFVFSIGMDGTVTELICAVGFFFAWFLHCAVVLPVTSLILQKKALDGNSNSGF